MILSLGDIASRAAEAGVLEFVPPDNASTFRDALDRLLALSPSEWRARGAMGRCVALDQFDIRRVIARWLAVYRRVLKTVHS